MFASTSTSIAWVILLISLAGWAFYAFSNIRSSRAEIGSEQKLAANRKPYYDDEILYWVLEPARTAGAQFGFEKRFTEWGATLFASTADGGYNCAGCHGGMKATGGVAAYAITDPKTAEVKSVSWKAPALNTVLYRYTDDEIRFVLNYGRPFSPMSAWGTIGGGPLTDQNLTTLIEYMKSIQIPQDNCVEPRGPYNPTCVDGQLPAAENKAIITEAQRQVDSGTYASVGEALFNLNVNSGAYSCARCHTKGWSYDDPQTTGGGALGPNLTGGSSVRQFPNQSEMIAFISGGSELGKRYGEQGQGSGRMPAFGQMYTDEQLKLIVEYVRGL